LNCDDVVEIDGYIDFTFLKKDDRTGKEMEKKQVRLIRQLKVSDRNIH
jgi:hypothetical protein